MQFSEFTIDYPITTCETWFALLVSNLLIYCAETDMRHSLNLLYPNDDMEMAPSFRDDCIYCIYI